MNFLHYDGHVSAGDTSVTFNGQTIGVPEQRQGHSGKLVFGVRPEHVSLVDGGSVRGEIIATEYLGTTQIVTVKTPDGVTKVRQDAAKMATVGDNVGLDFNEQTVTLFDASSGRALVSALNEGVLEHG